MGEPAVRREEIVRIPIRDRGAHRAGRVEVLVDVRGAREMLVVLQREGLLTTQDAFTELVASECIVLSEASNREKVVVE